MVLAQLGYERAYLYYLLWVETDGRFVKNEHVGVADQRLRDADTLLISL